MIFRRTTIITVGLLAFLGGLAFARTNWLVSLELVISLGIFCVVTVLRLRWLAVLSILLFGFGCGWYRGQLYLQKISPLAELSGARVTAVVRADSDAVYDQRGQLSFDASRLEILEPYKQDLPGRLVISGFGEPAVFKGDAVKISGRLHARRGSKQLGMSYANLKIHKQGGSWIDNLRRRFSAGLASAVPEPQASFGLGLLIGQRSNLPKLTTDQLAAVGLTHIIAVSGYNLTIIVRGVKRFLRNRSKYQITAVSFLLITTFLLMTGFSASIVRAAIVSGLSIMAWYYGRSFRPILLLSLAAVLTAGANPLYIWSDIGWYLSFLAFFGVMILSPLINKRLFKGSEVTPILALLSESLSAVIMTMPLIMFIFNQASIIALPANLIIAPFVPVAMFLSVIAGIAGMIIPALAGIIAWPASIVLTFMLDAAALLSKIPHALVNYGLTLSGLLTAYVCLVFIALVLWRITLKNAKITDITKE